MATYCGGDRVKGGIVRGGARQPQRVLESNLVRFGHEQACWRARGDGQNNTVIGRNRACEPAVRFSADCAVVLSEGNVVVVRGSAQPVSGNGMMVPLALKHLGGGGRAP